MKKISIGFPIEVQYQRVYERIIVRHTCELCGLTNAPCNCHLLWQEFLAEADESVYDYDQE